MDHQELAQRVIELEDTITIANSVKVWVEQFKSWFPVDKDELAGDTAALEKVAVDDTASLDGGKVLWLG